MSLNKVMPSNMKQTSSFEDSGVSLQVPLENLKDESTHLLGSEIKSGIDNAGNANVTLEIELDNVSEKVIPESQSSMSRFDACHSTFLNFLSTNAVVLKRILLGSLLGLYIIFFTTALVFAVTHYCNDHDVMPLVTLTCVGFTLLLISFISSRFGDTIFKKVLQPIHTSITLRWNILKWVFVLLPTVGIVIVITTTVWQKPGNLISLAGMAFFIFILFISSAHPTRIKLRPVVGGFILQFYFATLILKWDVGYRAFSFLGENARKFLFFTDDGSRFVFGEKFLDHIFVMKVLPVIVFFSSVITILYHLGIMQIIISKIAFVMRISLGTTAAESLCAAGNIFVGLTEAPVLIRPYLALMTKSEMHTVMVGGFATIAGGVMAAYISFGIPPEHLLSASVMNAAGSLAVSKLLWPETEKSVIITANVVAKENRQYRNVLEAAAAGASQSIPLVANIAANLIAFLGLLSFVNATIGWFGSFVCNPDLSFEKIFHYVLMPVVYLMGVRWEDAGQIAELLAIKTVLNEFVAYEKLAKLIKSRKACSRAMHILSIRSETIATYALCGFSNLSCIGIMLGGLGPMAPSRISDMAQVVFRALFGGIITCLITACVAGLLVIEAPSIDGNCLGNGTLELAGLTTVLTVTTAQASTMAP